MPRLALAQLVLALCAALGRADDWEAGLEALPGDECDAGGSDDTCALSALQLRARQESQAAAPAPAAEPAQNASLLEKPTYSASCFAYTGGTCVAGLCDADRGAKCVGGKCVCSGC